MLLTFTGYFKNAIRQLNKIAGFLFGFCGLLKALFFSGILTAIACIPFLVSIANKGVFEDKGTELTCIKIIRWSVTIVFSVFYCRREYAKNKELLESREDIPGTRLARFLGKDSILVKFLNAYKQDYDIVAEGDNVPPQMMRGRPEGFYFGKRGRRHIVRPESDEGHILVVGGPGSGKSAGHVIPTLLTWQGPFFAIDIKGTLCEETSARFPDAKVLAPATDSPYRYDVFSLLENATTRSQCAKEIATSIITIPESYHGDKYWLQSAQNLLTACILHFYSMGADFAQTMRDIQLIPINKLIEWMEAGKTFDEHGDIVDGTPVTEALVYVNQVPRDEKGLGYTYSEMCSRITVFTADPDIRKAFTPSEDKQYNLCPGDIHQECIYFCIPEDKISQWESAQTLVINLKIRGSERLPDNNKVSSLLILDEFPRLGKIEGITGALATLRSKGITICLVIQSLAQLDKLYGVADRRIMLDSCNYVAVLRANDVETQEYFSKRVGTYDKFIESRGITIDPDTGMESSSSTNKSIQEKRIVKPEDFATLSDVVMLTPYGYFRTEKLYYYDKRFPIKMDKALGTVIEQAEPEDEEPEADGYRPPTTASPVVKTKTREPEQASPEAVHILFEAQPSGHDREQRDHAHRELLEQRAQIALQEQLLQDQISRYDINKAVFAAELAAAKSDLKTTRERRLSIERQIERLDRRADHER